MKKEKNLKAIYKDLRELIIGWAKYEKTIS